MGCRVHPHSSPRGCPSLSMEGTMSRPKTPEATRARSLGQRRNGKLVRTVVWVKPQ